VIGETDAEGLDPGEVTTHGRVAFPDEMGIDVEASIRDDTEVLILLSMEVEVVAVGARETRVPAGDAEEDVALLKRK
jgi:hypothetical protein